MDRRSSKARDDHGDDEHEGALREPECPAERGARCEDVPEERLRSDRPAVARHCEVPAYDERQVQDHCDAPGENGGPRRAAEARCEGEHRQPEDAPRLEAGRQADDERRPQSPSAPRLDRGHDPEQGQKAVRGMPRVEDMRGESGRHGCNPGEREEPRSLHPGGQCGSHHEQRRRGGEQHRKRARRAADGAVKGELERADLRPLVCERVAPVPREEHPTRFHEHPRVAAFGADDVLERGRGGGRADPEEESLAHTASIGSRRCVPYLEALVAPDDLRAARRCEQRAVAVVEIRRAEGNATVSLYDAARRPECSRARRTHELDAQVGREKALVLLEHRPARSAHRGVEEGRHHAAVHDRARRREWLFHSSKSRS